MIDTQTLHDRLADAWSDYVNHTKAFPSWLFVSNEIFRELATNPWVCPSRNLSIEVVNSFTGKRFEFAGYNLATAIKGEPLSSNLPKNALNRQEGGSHYKDLAIQPVEYITKNRLDYLSGNVIKYVTRHAAKGGREDLEKAKHYIDLMLELNYGD